MGFPKSQRHCSPPLFECTTCDVRQFPVLVTFTSTGNCVIQHKCTVRPDYYDCLLKHITKYTHTRRLTLFFRTQQLLSDSRMSPGWEGDRDSLAVPAGRMARQDKKHVFVLNFFGDVQASQAASLREEVTAVLRQSKKSRGDEGTCCVSQILTHYLPRLFECTTSNTTGTLLVTRTSTGNCYKPILETRD